MSRKSFIILISVLLAVILGILVAYYFLLTKNNADRTGEDKGFSFFPFGQSAPITNTPPATTTEEQPRPLENLKNFEAKLRLISNEAVAGAGLIDSKAGTVVRHIEKATGHIYETELFSPVQNRISNTTLPQVYDAIWGNKNISLVARYLKGDDETVDTYSLSLKSSTASTTSVSAVAFPLNISDVSVFGANIFYLLETQKSSTGYVATFDGKTRRQIWNSPIREVNSQFVNANMVALTTRPEQNIPGYLYVVNTGTGSIKTLLSGILGLSALVSPDGNQALYLSQGGAAQFYLLDQKNKLERSQSPITFPEKCVWSRKSSSVAYCAVPEENLDGSSLIYWYKGLVSFTDDIWKYDLKNNTADLIENLSVDAGRRIDVIKPLLSDNEQYLVFINKRDGSLWSLNLTK